MSEGDGYETVDEEGGYTSGLEEGENSFVDIDDILGTRSDQEGIVREINMVRNVEVVASPGWRV